MSRLAVTQTPGEKKQLANAYVKNIQRSKKINNHLRHIDNTKLLVKSEK